MLYFMMTFLIDFFFPLKELPPKKRGGQPEKNTAVTSRMKLVVSHEVGVYLKRLDMWQRVGGEFEPMELIKCSKSVRHHQMSSCF